jgi:hypothetical protein
MSNHELGDWLAAAMPERLADGIRRERTCLASAPPLEAASDTIVMPIAPLMASPRRFKRITLLAALAALAAAIGGSAAAARRTPQIPGAPPSLTPPEPIVRPLLDPAPPPTSIPEHPTR